MSETGETVPGVDEPVEVVLPLPATPAATRLARSEISKRFEHLDQAVIDDVLLIVSELVNNAVQHGRPDIELHLRSDPLAVDLSVLDHGTELPPTAPVPVEITSTSGRGLSIINTLANSWGVEPLPSGEGKAVWAKLHTGTD